METVAVTEPEYIKARRVFETSSFHCVPVDPPENALCLAIKAHGARHAIVGIQPYSAELYATLGRGAVLARFGVGHEGIDQARATSAGVLCTNTPGVLVQSVAEHTISLLLAAARHTTRVAASMRQGEWSPLAGRGVVREVASHYWLRLHRDGCGAHRRDRIRHARGWAGWSYGTNPSGAVSDAHARLCRGGGRSRFR